jgi:hypothetical protein
LERGIRPLLKKLMAPGDVWFVELSMAEKNRPALVLAVPGDADARALVIRCALNFSGARFAWRSAADGHALAGFGEQVFLVGPDVGDGHVEAVDSSVEGTGESLEPGL